ncbi:MAG TPA: SMP-30/gluconolactonase/LRE family protein [Bryobacteraceae bacterium]|jgi:gluconolactonase|nr:SMP-30/gluconolactonase/LRE family protein [Bryobacteraceae bacterium]
MIKRTVVAVAAVLGGAAFWAYSEDTGHVEKLDGGLDALIQTSAKIERVATGFKWTEGPVWIHAGYLLFADIPSNSIRKWTPGEGASIWMQPSGYKGSAPYGGPEPGSNGMTLDSRGRLTVAGHAQRDVWRLESMDPQGQVTILAERYQGKRLNSPNDVIYKSDGALYFTDPPYGFRTQSDQDPDKELRVNGVYRIPHAIDQKPGAPPDDSQLELVVTDLPRPNGIAFSPDEKYLYVDNSEPQKVWVRYEVHADGSLSRGGKLFFDATSDTAPGAPDGMKVDRSGNIYSAGPGGVWIFSPEGKHLGTIRMPEKVANVAWGDEDGKTLYITASSSVYRVRTNVGGVKP